MGAAARLAPLLCRAACAAASQLTAEQTAWLLGVASGNASVGPFPAPSGAQAAALGKKADAFQARHELVNLRHGLGVDVVYADATFSQEAAYTDVGDSAIWTGHYLAAVAHRYAATSDAAALAAVNRTLAAFDRLTSCTGTDYLARYVGPTDDPYYAASGDFHGEHAYPGAGAFAGTTWLGDTSRDQYFGALLGLVSVVARVNDTAVRSYATTLALRLVGHVEPKGDAGGWLRWWIARPPQDKSSAVNPTPMFAATLMKTGMVLDPERYSKYADDYDKAFASEAALPQGPSEWKINDKYSEGYPDNLYVIGLYTLAMLETDPGKSATLETALRRDALDDGLDHLQASFYAFYLGVSQAGRTNAKVVGALQATLLDFVDPPKRDRAVDLSNEPMYQPHHSDTQAEHAILPRDRSSQDTYIWQRSPVELRMGHDSPKEFQSMDMFLPYWIARFAGVL